MILNAIRLIWNSSLLWQATKEALPALSVSLKKYDKSALHQLTALSKFDRHHSPPPPLHSLLRHTLRDELTKRHYQPIPPSTPLALFFTANYY
mmetsp:Transcript_4153/g.8703  ORF Transcript_4153/g.8703 Transcript_4153/m.8703 type:complete len:93 (-) Transcript_4153:159-437(-)